MTPSLPIATRGEGLRRPVLAIPEVHVDRILGTGRKVVPLSSLSDPELYALLGEALWVERAPAEEDPYFRQVVPYLALVPDGVDNRDRVLAYYRTPAGGEGRLHGRRSVGIGGHVEPRDYLPIDSVFGSGRAASNAVVAALHREAEEEAGLPADCRSRAVPVGFLVDDTTPVGRVHLGLAWVAPAPARLRPGAEVHDLAEVPLGDLAGPGRDELEPWSQLLVDHLVAVLNLNSDK